MDVFVCCILIIGFVDLFSLGCFFIWCNKRMGNDRIVCKLDRVMCNVKWMLNEIKGFVEF